MPPFVPRKRRRLISPSPPLSSSKTKSRTTNLFTAADSTLRAPASVTETKAFLDQLASEDDSSSLSDASSDKFEDVTQAPPPKRHKLHKEEDEDEIEWEDAIVEESTTVPEIAPPAYEPTGDLELTLDQARTWSSFKQADGPKKGPSKIERQIRLNTHCIHVQALMYHNHIRNRWACDKEVLELLHGHLTKGVKDEVEKWKKAMGNILEPNPIAKSSKREEGIVTVKGKKSDKKHRSQRDWGKEAQHLEPGVPNLSHGDPTIRLLKILAGFWKKRFIINAPGLRKQGYKDLERLQIEVRSFQNDEYDPEEHGERVRNLKEFRQLAKRCQGSRDVGAQLFSALIRSLGLEARLIANLQAVGFSWTKPEEANERKLNPKVSKGTAATALTKKKPQRTAARSGKRSPASGKKEEPISLSDTDSSLSSVGPSDEESIDEPVKLPGKKYDRDMAFPIYWTEVLSPISHKWIPVDPMVTSMVATNEEQLALFEPRGAKADKAKQVIAYVIAYSDNGTAKEVTTRYLKRHMWPGKTRGMRIPVEKVPVFTNRGKIKRHEDYDWFKTVMSGYTKHHRMRTVADDLEDATDLKPVKVEKQQKPGSEETLQGYKTSAEFVLERHLRREEALVPGAKAVKMFLVGKGDKAQEEPVYLRKDVAICRTAESWHKEGREVIPGSQPLKRVAPRAVTLIRKREIEENERETGEKMTQPLYSRDQTDWIIPPPIENGVIPKNVFGNMDVYVPSMVPRGAVHLKLRGAGKICRKLEIDYAEACTGFEFGNRRAVPVLTGVVVATNHRTLVVEAWKVAEEEKRKKEEAKRQKVALDMWKKMMKGLQIMEHLKEEYGDQADAHIQDAIHPMSKKKMRNHVAQSQALHVSDDDTMEGVKNDRPVFINDEYKSDDPGPGGFLRDVDEDEYADMNGGLSPDRDGSEATSTPTNAARTPISLQSLHRNKIKNQNTKLMVQDMSDSDLSDISDKFSSGNESVATSMSLSSRTPPIALTKVGACKSVRKGGGATKSPYFTHATDED